MQQVLMLERVVNQESISIVSRGGTKSMTSPKNYVVHMRQQRDRSVLVRMTIDLLKVAHDIFYSDHNTKFNLEHAWCVLRYEQKWLSLNTPKPSGSSKRKAGETCSQTSSTTVGDHEIRPEGIKAAKAKRNNAQGKSLDTSIWEMKKEDLMMKKKLSKLAILATLLAKKEPLSEAEEVVNNKLLAQYF